MQADDKISIRGISQELHDRARKAARKLKIPAGQFYNEALKEKLDKEETQ